MGRAVGATSRSSGTSSRPDPTAALATIDMRGRGRSSGAPAEMRFVQLWTFRDGRAVRMEMFSDIDEARRAAGLA